MDCTRPQAARLPLEVPTVAEMNMELLKNKVFSTIPSSVSSPLVMVVTGPVI